MGIAAKVVQNVGPTHDQPSSTGSEMQRDMPMLGERLIENPGGAVIRCSIWQAATMHCYCMTRDQAQPSLFDYIEVFYDRQRRIH